jgi:hypothetical protein
MDTSTSESQLHLMVTPKSIRQAKELAASSRLTLSELFAHLVLAEWERSKGQLSLNT